MQGESESRRRGMLADFRGPIRGAAWNRGYFRMSMIQLLSRKSGLLVIFTPISELRDFIVRRLPKQNRQIEGGPSSVRFAVAANALAGHPRVSRNFPGARPASFQGNRSQIPLACDDRFPRR